MAWIVAPNIKALFTSVNKIAPNRDKASDGTVGDLAHQQGTSGHNPDDYPGVTAERTDADRIAEVRAGDIDKDLRQPGLTMDRIAETIRTTPALRRRLIYIIWNRRIASASSGWVWKTYTGSNPHDKHLHVSGHPDYDNDSSPWREIEALVKEDDMTKEEHDALMAVKTMLTRLDGREPIGQAYLRLAVGKDDTAGAKPVEHPSLKSLGDQLRALAEKPTTTIDYDRLADAIVRRVLTTPPA